MGGEILLRLLIGVDVVVGPVITLLIFDPKKQSLKYDLAVIAVLQVAALAYGSYVMFEARPVYNVFVDDRFYTVPANSIDADSLARAAADYRPLPLDRTARGRGAQAARRPEEASRIGASGWPAAPTSRICRTCTPLRRGRAEAARAARPLVTLSQRGKDCRTR